MKKKLNKEQLDMRNKGKIPVKIYGALMSTGAQPSRLYGLAKVQKKRNPSETCSLYPGNWLSLT